MARKAFIQAIFKYVLGFGLLAFVIFRNWNGKVDASGTTIPGLKDLLSQTPDLLIFAAAIVCLFFTISLQFFRWYLLVRALDLRFSLYNAFRLGLVGYYYNTFLPGSIGGDFVKAFFIAKEQPGRRAAAVASVVADRLMGLFGLLLIAASVGSLCWLNGDERIVQNPWLQNIVKVTSGLVLGAVVGWIIMGFLPTHRSHRFASRLHSIPRIGHNLSELWLTVWTYRQRPMVIYQSIVISAVSHTFMVLLFHLCVRIFVLVGPGTLTEHFVLAPIGYIGQVFFPAPGGVGGGEVIFGYLYTLVERPKITGEFGRLALRLLEWTVGLCGYIAFLRMRKELPVEEQEPSEQEAITAVSEEPVDPTLADTKSAAPVSQGI